MSDSEPTKSQKKWIFVSCASIVTILVAVAVQGVVSTPAQPGSGREQELLSLLDARAKEFSEIIEAQLAEIAELKGAESVDLRLQALVGEKELLLEEKKEWETIREALEEKLLSLGDETFRKEIEELADLNDDLERSLDGKEGEIANLEEAVLSLAGVQEELLKAQGKLEQITREREDLVLAVEEGRGLIDILGGSNRSFKEELRQLLEEKTSFVASLERNADLIASLQETLLSLKTSYEEADKRAGQLGRELAEVQSKFDFLEDSSQTERQRLVATLEENANFITSLEERVKERDEALKSTAALEERNKELFQGEIGKLAKEREQLAAKNGDLTARNKADQERIAYLADIEVKYREEKKQRMIKEQLLEKLQAHLEQQKGELEVKERSRIALTEELGWAQRSIAKMGEKTPVAGAQVATRPQLHIVQTGETLMHISEKYYGTTKKWKRIFEANKDLLPNENTVQPGIALVIP